MYIKDREIGFIDGFALVCELNGMIEHDSKVWRHEHMDINICHLLSQRNLWPKQVWERTYEFGCWQDEFQMSYADLGSGERSVA